MRCILLFCILMLLFAQGSVSLVNEPINICYPDKEILLESQGESASASIILDAGTVEPLSGACTLKVSAPKSHVVSFQFLENVNHQSDHNKTDNRTCFLSIYLPDNTKSAFWKGDLCSGDKMSDVDLLTSEFKILWIPPKDNTTTVFQKTIILTAVGSGTVCKEAFQHTCMRIGRIPMLCISDHLICDGIQNCPKSSTNSDEDPKLCSTAKNAWENFVVELVKKYRPPEEKYGITANASDVEWFEWSLDRRNITGKPEIVNDTRNVTESISAMINKYGPWGYLMMGLLICGTVLFFCGLWECCCKRPKLEGDSPPQTAPTTVLIMNCESSLPHPLPPQYDDLDLPPSYTTLFPGDEGRYTSLSEEPAPSGSDEDGEKNDQSSSEESVQNSETVQVNNSEDASQDAASSTNDEELS